MPEKEVPPRQGRLTIYLGYAPGIGKTHAMLEAALQQRSEGIDVEAACLDIRMEAFPPALMDDLGINPRQSPRSELDLDALLARRPELALIDRLEHANPPEARHPWRWQDVEEILAQGIDVYTTLNVSEIESLTDTAGQIAHTVHAQHVPDSLVEKAEIVLVDLPPEQLIQRLETQVPASLAEHLDLSSLTALRELALSLAANRVDTRLRGYLRGKAAAGPLPARERLMVCVSTHPLSERLVRTGCRLAREMKADWEVVYVVTPDRLSYSPAHSERLARILRLAEDLGAKVSRTSGRRVAEALIEYARTNQITHMIVGKPYRPRLMEILNGSIVDDIIRHSGSIDVYVVNDSSGPMDGVVPSGWTPHRPWRRYLAAIGLVGLVSILNIPIHFFIEPTNLVMLYLLAVIISALYLGRGPSLVASALSVLAFDFFFVDPRLSFSVADTQYILTFLGLFGTGLAVSSLAGLVRSQVEASQSREARTAMLYNLSRELTVTPDLEAVFATVLKHLDQTFDRKAVILLPDGQNLKTGAASEGLELGEKEMAAALWAFRQARPSGRGSGTMPETAFRWQPLQTAQGVVGVVGVRPAGSNPSLSSEQLQVLEAYSSLAALAVERASLAEQASRTRLLQEAEKLQTALLNSISHDLRTPLASITGVFSSLHEAEVGADEVVMDRETRLELVDTGWEEAERLNRLVGNLLDMSRLEAGAVHLNCEDGDIEDVIGSALLRMHSRLQKHIIRTSVPEHRPLAKIDFVLLEQVLINLLDNAAKYSPPGSEIEVGVEPAAQYLQVWVADHGRGIPQADLERIFEKFYRVERPDGIRGTGLGLSICKGIVEAHGGHIWAENRLEGGARISFRLSAVQDTLMVAGDRSKW